MGQHRQHRSAKTNTKSAKVRRLLAEGKYGARDIAEVVGCSVQLVTDIRRKIEAPYTGSKTSERLARVEGELKICMDAIAVLIKTKRTRLLSSNQQATSGDIEILRWPSRAQPGI